MVRRRRKKKGNRQKRKLEKEGEENRHDKEQPRVHDVYCE